MTELFNKSNLRKKRRLLRQNSTKAENILWSRLRAKRFFDIKFRRQYSVGGFVVDFYCPKLKLAIEIDGDSHIGDEAEEYDRARQKYIESAGIRFLRFTNNNIYYNLESVLNSISEFISKL